MERFHEFAHDRHPKAPCPFTGDVESPEATWAKVLEKFDGTFDHKHDSAAKKTGIPIAPAV